jgi:hypothetical protein
MTVTAAQAMVKTVSSENVTGTSWDELYHRMMPCAPGAKNEANIEHDDIDLAITLLNFALDLSERFFEA